MNVSRAELSLAVGILPERRIDGGVRVPVLGLLLVVQDAPAWLHAAVVLLRVHVSLRYNSYLCLACLLDTSVQREGRGEGETDAGAVR